jgi:nitrogen fixation protein FixH
MTLAFMPDPPVADQDTRFRLKLTDAAGKAVSGAQVKATLVMTTMDMGKNELIFTEQGGGDYQATAKFTMSGPWNALVDATAGGKSGQQTFPVVVHAE